MRMFHGLSLENKISGRKGSIGPKKSVNYTHFLCSSGNVYLKYFLATDKITESDNQNYEDNSTMPIKSANVYVLFR